MIDESSALVLPHRQRQDATPSRNFVLITLIIAVAVAFAFALLLAALPSSRRVRSGQLAVVHSSTFPLYHERITKRNKMTDHVLSVPPTPMSRCQWVIDQFVEKDGPDPNGTIFGDVYRKQSPDFNVFYRATAHLFWKDFSSQWGNLPRLLLAEEFQLVDEIPLSPKSTWTWVTGDQHLSNFGAWRNRHGDVVFGVNDFDEAAIYDFHIDVLRIAVSICNHARTNGLGKSDTSDVLKAFTKSYIETVLGYIGNDDALLFELTPQTSHGELKKFLKKVEKSKSAIKQLAKFTDVNQTTGLRFFIKGGIGETHEDTRLAALSPQLEAAIRAAFTATRYGATMVKLGWNTREWDDDYFRVLDVAGRIDSGIGSFGVPRFYVLLKGSDTLLGKGDDGAAVILDVKFEPLSAVQRILDTNDLAWYDAIFTNAASQVTEGQRRLTSYVDPFTGWILLEDDKGVSQPYSVRQRSPWKDSFDLESLVNVDDFVEFSSQIATATATSHVRGTTAKAPADFKNVIQAIMADKDTRKEWGHIVEAFARSYHKQVLLDYECFKDYVNTKYIDLNASNETALNSDEDPE